MVEQHFRKVEAGSSNLPSGSIAIETDMVLEALMLFNNDDAGCICGKHGLDAAVRMVSQLCPECHERDTFFDYKRCEVCAGRKNKCVLCDGKLRDIE